MITAVWMLAYDSSIVIIKRKGKHTANTQSLCREKRNDLVIGKPRQRPFEDLLVWKGFILWVFNVSSNFVHNFLSEPCCRLVFIGNALNCSDSLVLAAPGHEELGRFIEGEEQEAGKEHGKCDSTQGQDKISPAHVVFFGARAGIGARISGNKCPGKQTGNQITNRPEHSQTTQDIPRCKRQEFQEDGCIHGHISAYSQAQASEQSTGSAYR